MSLHTHWGPEQEERYLASPTGSDTTFLSQQEEEKIPLAQYQLSVWEPAVSQPVKSLYFELSVSSSGLFVCKSPSQVRERAFLPFVSPDLLVICHGDHMSQIAVLCCF